jgi:hypothetical protein
MTVKELKEQLNQYSDDMEVYVQVYYNIFCVTHGKLNNFKTRDNKLCLEYMNPALDEEEKNIKN